ncbi:MAG: hypothetical protein MUQ65_16225, partial [Armatimonadetes bacterium]|nr:hypothetical protein [Armatimonadota bacterium]
MSRASARKVMSLDGEWRYRTDPERTGEDERLFEGAAATGDRRSIGIPANWYMTELGDYHGVVWFARDFELDPEIGNGELILRFNAVDYLADVWLNGTYLGRHEGFFAPFEFRVTKLVKAGRNSLVVELDSPKDPTEYRPVPDPPGFERPLSEPFKTRKPVALTTIKGSCIDFWHRPGWETQYGQDGNTGGIWRSVELIATGSLSIQRAKITPTLVRRGGELDGTALVTADLDVYSAGGETVMAEIGMEAYGKTFGTAEPISKGKEVVLTPGWNRVKLVQTFERPVLWWCWDHGEPDLYEMRLTVAVGGQVQDEVVETFGIRELRVDEKGQWLLNGKRVFARGMRYYSSVWL